ncbi:membrane protein [Asanoa ishikariensis]|uniref:TIGR03943 family protein n=1 Tax=Asanoa ishikariensis TaxID=137265 RepID=A0A1H3NQW5_9ACTN|nr:TIGR03943 family protein [Asanoa ishikariensis]GIF68435.1 membrane protein [Asanoa ishikariensis]SDY91224.1 TIGR03943 family protein [Asanoa ishikariensis]
MNRQAQGVVLLLLGGAVLKASLTDVYLRYVKEGLQPFLIAAGAVLVVAAVVTLAHDLRQQLRGTKNEKDSHDHSGHGPTVGWLLVLPVIGLLLVAPPALGSFAAGQSGTALSSQAISDYPPLPPGDPAKISVLEYASRAIYDNGTSIGDRTVQMSGFVSPGVAGELLLTRMILSCCAADGRPIKLGMTGGAPVDLPADTWIEVTGKYSSKAGTDPVNGEQIPYIDVQTWVRIEPPRNQYQ